MLQNQKSHLRSGFSFIEITIVLVIMAALMGTVGRNALNFFTKGRTRATEATLKAVKSAVVEYKGDTGQYPETLTDLVNPSKRLPGYSGPYLQDVEDEPLDAWGAPLRYRKNDRGANPPFELYSEGDPDKDEANIYA